MNNAWNSPFLQTETFNIIVNYNFTLNTFKKEILRLPTPNIIDNEEMFSEFSEVEPKGEIMIEELVVISLCLFLLKKKLK